MKYNYVIFGYNWDFYKSSYKDVIDLVNVEYVPNHLSRKHEQICLVTEFNKIIYFLYRIHHSVLINNIINLPFKKVWFNFYFKNKFKDENPICFVFFGRNAILEKFGYIDFLKKKYPKSKNVCFFQDLIHTHEIINIAEIKRGYDLVISYDSVEAKNYNINYHPTVYSKFFVEYNTEIPKSDVYFLGAAKNRFDKIISIYQYLQSKGLKCEFYLTNVNLEDQLHYEGIHYISQMSYQKNLEHILRTECILEVMQKNATGYTMRTWEAIMYDKKLLTDNIEIIKAPFFNEANISVFENTDVLESSDFFFEDFSRKTDHHYKENISPVKLLEFIERELQKKKT
jgi:hypothetical protein